MGNKDHWSGLSARLSLTSCLFAYSSPRLPKGLSANSLPLSAMTALVAVLLPRVDWGSLEPLIFYATEWEWEDPVYGPRLQHGTKPSDHSLPPGFVKLC